MKIIIDAGNGLFGTEVGGKHACGHVTAFVGSDGYKQVSIFSPYFLQSLNGSRRCRDRH